MSLPTSVTDRLGKMLSLLDSDRDGEVVAAACAIQRVLKSAGADLSARTPRDVVRIAGKPCRIGPGLRRSIQRMAKGGGR